MLLHVLKNALIAAEILYMAQHVELIVADYFIIIALFKHLHVVGRRCHSGYARSREGDF